MKKIKIGWIGYGLVLLFSFAVVNALWVPSKPSNRLVEESKTDANRSPRSDAYTHIFEVVVLVPDTTSGSVSTNIMRLRSAENAAATDSRVTFLPSPSEMKSLLDSIAANSEGDYQNSLRATQVDESHWEFRLSTGGNTSRDISTYRTDGRSITPIAYERRAALSPNQRYVYNIEREKK